MRRDCFATARPQDCFYATLEKNKKVMITVGSVGVQFFSVNKKGKVSLTPSKTITFTSLLKWSKRISRQEQKVWVVLRITSVAPSVFFKTTNAPAGGCPPRCRGAPPPLDIKL